MSQNCFAHNSDANEFLKVSSNLYILTSYRSRREPYDSCCRPHFKELSDKQACCPPPFLMTFCEIIANIYEHVNVLSPESVSPRLFKPCKSRLGRKHWGRAKARPAPHNKTAARQKDLHKRTYKNPHHTHTKKRENNQTDGVGRPKAAPHRLALKGSCKAHKGIRIVPNDQPIP